MANILDYLKWRGDLPLSAAPFNEVDNLILAELSFVDFAGIVPKPGEGASIPLRDAAARYFSLHPRHTVDMGVLVPDEIFGLLEEAAKTVRFRDVGLNCFAELYDPQEATQFAALTAELPDGTLYLAFRGTDDTLAGWREDFEMSFLEQVPAHGAAEAYVRQVAAQYKRKKLRLGGHSKGGNLAVYSGVHCPERIQRRILNIYNNDGPGFRESLLGRPEHMRVADRITTIVPESSVVGMLLEHAEEFTVVKSSYVGMFQHDGFSWGVMGAGFVHLPPDSYSICRNDETLRALAGSLDTAQRRQFTEALFNVLSSTGAETLMDLTEDGFKTATSMLKALAGLDRDTRNLLTRVVGQLFKSQVKAIAEDIRDDLKEERKSAEEKIRTGKERVQKALTKKSAQK